uniref:uncharacterized protein LOC120332708 n=1 Tax=Styela clava TaxID=7725 RepID=UPI00193A3ABA|nr:uncharacterized protein LOC120332708 [Styela clava]
MVNTAMGIGNYQNMNLIQKIDSNLRLEICTSKQEREDFYKRAGESFHQSTISLRHLPNVEKRRKFLPAYFRYLHESSLTSGKAILMALKKRENVNGKEVWKIVYSGIYVYDTSPTVESDSSEIMEIDREAVEEIIKRDKWHQKNIDGPLREIAKSAGSAAWLLARQATTPEYKQQKYGLNYSRIAAKIAYELGLKIHADSGKAPFKIQPFEYVAFNDTFSGGFELMDKIGLFPIAHLHYNFKPGLKCYHESEKGTDRSQHSCYFIMVDKNIHPKLKQALEKGFKAKL